jgi:hypothetical protein
VRVTVAAVGIEERRIEFQLVETATGAATEAGRGSGPARPDRPGRGGRSGRQTGSRDSRKPADPKAGRGRR